MAGTSTPPPGANVTATSATLVELGADPTTDHLAALALTLAATLDAGAGSQVAAVSRELRSTLAEVKGRLDSDTDPLDDFLAGLREPQ
jgi:hypothetical protein